MKIVVFAMGRASSAGMRAAQVRLWQGTPDENAASRCRVACGAVEHPDRGSDAVVA
jgi:hypothetical protein